MRNPVPIVLIKSLGFRVFVHDLCSTYCFFVEENKIGYLQTEVFGNFSLSSVHKPNQRTGTGFSIARDLTAADLTAATLRKAFVMYPNWASSADRESVQKYKNVEEFLKSVNIVMLTYFEV